MSSIGAISTSGLIAAQTDVAVVATNIANSSDGTATGPAPAPTAIGSSAVSAPVTGTQPSGAAGQVFQALTATNTTTAGGGVAATVGTEGGLLSPGIVQDLTNLNAATTAYQANLATLEAGTSLAAQALSLFA